MPVRVGGQLRLGVPVDASDGLGLFRRGPVEEPRHGAGVGGRVLECHGGMVFVPGHGQVGEKPGVERDRPERGAAVGGQTGPGDLADVFGDELRQSLGTIEMSAGAIDEIRQRPVGMVLAFVEDAAVRATDVVPQGSVVGLVLTPFLCRTEDHERGRMSIFRREMIVFQPDSGQAAVGRSFYERVHHEQVPRLADGQPRYRGNLVVTRGFRQAIEHLLQKHDLVRVVVLGLEIIERFREEHDAQAVGGAHGANRRVPDQHVFGNVGAQDQQTAQLPAVFWNPQVGGRARLRAVSPAGKFLTPGKLEHLVDRRTHRLRGGRAGAVGGERRGEHTYGNGGSDDFHGRGATGGRIIGGQGGGGKRRPVVGR